VPSTPERLSEIQKIGIRICEHIHKHPFTTKSQLEKVSGSQNFLKASKNKVRDALHQLINDGDIELHQVTNIDRQNNSIPKQVQEVLRLSIFKTASMQAIFDTGRK
jgi:DNA-binding FadR family transcriptional regulator